MSRELHHMHPLMLPVILKCKQQWALAGLDILITCTYRSNEEQAAIYAEGRTKPGKIRTRAKPGQSAHNFAIVTKEKNIVPASLAFDIVPLRFGKTIWGTQGNGIDNDPSDDLKDDLELWQRAAEVCKKLGLVWYGDPGSSFREFPHFQHPNTREMMQL